MPLNFAPFSKKSRFGIDPYGEIEDALGNVCPEKPDSPDASITKPEDVLAAQANALTLLGIGACSQWDNKDSNYVMKDKQNSEVTMDQESKSTRIKTFGVGGSHSTTTTNTDAKSNRNTDITNQITMGKGNIGCEAISYATNQLLSATQNIACSIADTKLNVSTTANSENIATINIKAGCLVLGDVEVLQKADSSVTFNTTIDQNLVSNVANTIKTSLDNIVDKSVEILEANKGSVSGDAGEKSFSDKGTEVKDEISKELDGAVRESLETTIKVLNESGIDCGMESNEYATTISEMHQGELTFLQNNLDKLISLALDPNIKDTPLTQKIIEDFTQILNEEMRIAKERWSESQANKQPYIIVNTINGDIDIKQDIIVKMVSKAVIKNVINEVSNYENTKSFMEETKDVIEKDYKYETTEQLADAIAAGADLVESGIPPMLEMDMTGIIQAAGEAHAKAVAANNPDQNYKTSSFTKIIIGLVVVLVLFAGGLGIFYYMHSKKSVSDSFKVVEEVVQEFGRRLRKFGKTAKKFF